jgi:putative phosphoesterase
LFQTNYLYKELSFIMENILVLSDIHSNFEALKAVFNDVKEKNINPSKIIIDGDVISLGPNPNECLEYLKTIKNIYFIQGNHDRYIINKEFLKPDAFSYYKSKNLPIDFINQLEWTFNQLSDNDINFINSWNKNYFFKENEKSFYITHGLPGNDELGILPENINADFYFKNSMYNNYIFGHTHCPFIHSFNNINYINSGSVGCPLDKDARASYLSISIGEEILFNINRVQYDIEKTIKEIYSKNVPMKELHETVLRKAFLN